MIDQLRRLMGGRQVTMTTDLEACIPCIAAIVTGSDALLSPEGRANLAATRRRFKEMEPVILPILARAKAEACPLCKTVSDDPRHRMTVTETYWRYD